jgi:hypothetical protein
MAHNVLPVLGWMIYTVEPVLDPFVLVVDGGVSVEDVKKKTVNR